MHVGKARTVDIRHKIRGHALVCVAVEVEAHFLSLRESCQLGFAQRSAVVLNDALQKVEKGKSSLHLAPVHSLYGRATYFTAQKKLSFWEGPLHKGHDRRWRAEERKVGARYYGRCQQLRSSSASFIALAGNKPGHGAVKCYTV